MKLTLDNEELSKLLIDAGLVPKGYLVEYLKGNSIGGMIFILDKPENKLEKKTT